MDADLELFQFRYSHYNEKVRWVLDFKGLPYRRTDLLPGPHARVIKKLTGQTQTPVLRMNGEYVHDSAWIIERLELIFKDAPSLYPRDETIRNEALELAHHFDFVVGPAARVCAFVGMLDSGDYIARMFSAGQPFLDRSLYRVAFPFVKGPLKRANGMTDRTAIAEADRLVAANMESIAKRTFKSKYLAGNEFSIADLTAAALLAPLLDPPHPDMKKPDPQPRKLAALTEKWRAHPAGRWVLDIYERHRPLINRS